MDEIAQRMLAIEWQYGDKDPEAHAILKKRIGQTAQKRALLTYSELVKGVTFRLPNLMNGAPHKISPWEWTGLDRRIVGDFLGHISMETYTQHNFMASAIVVSGLDAQPSQMFFDWMKELGILQSLSQDDVLAFWAEHVKKAHRFYLAQKRSGESSTSADKGRHGS